MSLRMNTFTKIVGIIVLLLIPIIMLYWYSNKTSMDVVMNEVEISMHKDLSYFAAKTDETAVQLARSGLTITEDINVRNLEFIEIATLYEQTEEKLRISDKLRLINASSEWDPAFSVYAPATDTFVSTNPSLEYDPDLVAKNYSKVWKYTEYVPSYYQNHPRFVRYISEPYDSGSSNAGLVVEVSFAADELVKALGRFKQGGKGDAFFVSPGGQRLAVHGSDESLQGALLAKVDLHALSQQEYTRIKLNGVEYTASSVYMPELGWYLFDYLPIQDVVKPITSNSNLFYSSIVFLLFGSMIAAYVLYTNVQVPIRELIRGVKKLKKGEYSKLKVFHPNNEFHFLLVSFNDMAEQIEQLIQNVYLEQIRSRDANLKQLQSQINPHFLYNCFSLIRSLTRLGEKESVMDLALHLSRYYRYTTRSERQLAYVKEEVDLVQSYLAIQAMNVQDMSYTVSIPEAMQELEIPRLILQPIVENAVLHGLEPLGGGEVHIVGTQNDRYNIITVRDNGIGVTEEQLAQLELQMSMPPTEDKGCALWNTRKRMLLQYGQEAGLRLYRMEEGGLAAELYWPNESSGE
ncbi:sensor histidine kinase [Paenibacillus protaetiae]|uniref:Sensor histidine kinase n=1 Tax=Paenibacillus protaetiae TaxID=2509456 RepID=A0A4P6EUG2_9BACL|nr:sensor histidine kinase [Paenibacillus protaetiae]QAY65279.1 sensor histidine kinase [Paenibacillus protaetiae]